MELSSVEVRRRRILRPARYKRALPGTIKSAKLSCFGTNAVAVSSLDHQPVQGITAPQPCQFFTSNRRMADQGPEPPALFARTRHHMVSVGNVLVLN